MQKMNRLAVCVLLLAVVVAAEEAQLVQNERKLQGLLLPLAAKAVAAKAVVAKAAVAGAVVSQGAAALAAAAPKVSVEEAPCQQVCTDKCSVTMEKQCKTVPVTKKECSMVPKTVTEKRCNKNCQVTIGHGRKMKGVLLPLAAKAVVAKAVVAKAAVAGAVVAKAAAMAPSVDCEVVCEDVPVTVNELQCKDVTTDVEQCINVPKHNCEKVCVCVPMKQVTVTMGHPLMAGN